jgi:hypothetical protein
LSSAMSTRIAAVGVWVQLNRPALELHTKDRNSWVIVFAAEDQTQSQDRVQWRPPSRGPREFRKPQGNLDFCRFQTIITIISI